MQVQLIFILPYHITRRLLAELKRKDEEDSKYRYPGLCDQGAWTGKVLSYVSIYFCSANWTLVGLSYPFLLPAFLALPLPAISDSYVRQF